MADQPSKESLERSTAFIEARLGQRTPMHDWKLALALEFDAIAANAKEKESCRLAVETNRIVQTRLADLHQQNAALVSALRDTRLILAGYCAQNPRWFYAGQEQDPSGAHALLEKVDEILASYAPAEAEAKEKP